MEIDEKLPFLQEKGNKEKQCRERLTNCKRPQKVSKYKCELPNSISTLSMLICFSCTRQNVGSVIEIFWENCPWTVFNRSLAKVPKLDF